MRRLLNTLYVTTQGAYLARDGETVLIRVEQETKLRLPVHTLAGIVCFGQVACSPPLMGLCAERGVAISFLSEHGRFFARVQGAVHGNVLLRRQQYRIADNPGASADIARAMVLAKIANCRTLLMRAARERDDEARRAPLDQASRELAGLLRLFDEPQPLERVRGLEGDAARIYFSVFDHLMTGDRAVFFWKERSRRPPLDAVNALLSFLYTLLRHDTEAALETVGLDAAVGFLHRDRPGRTSLALDLMEEFRPLLADRLALAMINRRQLRADHFQPSQSGAVYLNEAGRKEVLQAWQKRKQEEMLHPFLDERMPLGMLPFVQALLLARYLRGDSDAYPAFLGR